MLRYDGSRVFMHSDMLNFDAFYDVTTAKFNVNYVVYGLRTLVRVDRKTIEVEKRFKTQRVTIQQDNDPKHTTGAAKVLPEI